MFGIGETELVIILLFAFMLFGPDKLPGMGRTIGRALRQFREAQEGFTKVVQTEIVDPINKAADDPDILLRRRKAISEDKDIDADDETPEQTSAAEGESTQTSSKRESFAERRARLQAEAAEAANSSDAAPESAEANAEIRTEDTEALATESEVSQASTDESEASVETPTTSVAALYGLTAVPSQASVVPDEASGDADVSTKGKEGKAAQD